VAFQEVFYTDIIIYYRLHLDFYLRRVCSNFETVLPETVLSYKVYDMIGWHDNYGRQAPSGYAHVRDACLREQLLLVAGAKCSSDTSWPSTVLHCRRRRRQHGSNHRRRRRRLKSTTTTTTWH